MKIADKQKLQNLSTQTMVMAIFVISKLDKSQY